MRIADLYSTEELTNLDQKADVILFELRAIDSSIASLYMNIEILKGEREALRKELKQLTTKRKEQRGKLIAEYLQEQLETTESGEN